MKATVLTAFKGVADGETQTKPYQPGDTIHGDLASAMVDAGFAEEITGKKAALIEEKITSTDGKSTWLSKVVARLRW